MKSKILYTALAASLTTLLMSSSAQIHAATSPEGEGQCHREGHDVSQNKNHARGKKMSPEHIEGRVAFLKAELKINDSQRAAWTNFESAMRSGMEKRAEQHKMNENTSNMNAVEQLDKHIGHLETRLAHMKLMQDALGNLYAALDNDQQQIADKLLPQRHHKKKKI
ncbi:MAG: hypothetical protein ACI8P9_003102 [Parasphingorhabdus sp.]|jgi:uncharacterized protein YhaN